MPERDETFKLDYYINLIFKHRWLMIIPFCLAMIVGIYLALTLPKIYQASTLIMVEPQSVPSNFVREIISTDIDLRIATIKQQILSRTYIEKIIDKFKGFKKIRITILILVFLLIVTGGYSAIPYPRMEGTDSTEEVHKIISNSPFTLHFSQRMNKESVEKSFEIHPKVQGDFVWINGKTLEYHPNTFLEVYDNYKIIIGAEAKNIYGKTFAGVSAPFFVFQLSIKRTIKRPISTNWPPGSLLFCRSEMLLNYFLKSSSL